MQIKSGKYFGKHLSMAIISLCLLSSACNTCSSPESALEKFYTSNGAEDTLMDPLIVCGEKVAPLVTQKIKDRNMKRRLYAISFLGNEAYSPSSSMLQEILADPTEDAAYRAASLQALCEINYTDCTSHLQRYKDEKSSLGSRATRILSNGGTLSEKRSYLQAVLGWHD
jgi:hypothetical protein